MNLNFNNINQKNNIEKICFSNGKISKDPALMGAFRTEQEKIDPFTKTDDKTPPRLITHNPRTDLTFYATDNEIKAFTPIALKLLWIFQDVFIKYKQKEFSLNVDDCIRSFGCTEQRQIQNYRVFINKLIPCLGSYGVEAFSEIRTRSKSHRKTVQKHSYITYFKKLEYIPELHIINVFFNELFIDYIKDHGIVQAPRTILQIDNRDQTTLQIATKLLSYEGCNKNNKISISNVLEAVPSLSYREERIQDKPKRYIQIPFLQSLKGINKLQIIKDYNFVQDDQIITPVTAEAMTFKQFENLYLVYTQAEDQNMPVEEN